MLHGTCNRILISNNETENKKYRSVGTVQKSNRKTKNTSVGTVAKYNRKTKNTNVGTVPKSNKKGVI